MMISFTVPGEVVPWARARLGKAGIHFTPEKQRSYMAVIKNNASEAMAGRPPLKGPIELRILAVFPYPASWSKKRRTETTWKTSKPDRSNIEKIVEDALNLIAWDDDAQVASGHCWKRYGDVPGLWVEIRSLEDSAPAVQQPRPVQPTLFEGEAA